MQASVSHESFQCASSSSKLSLRRARAVVRRMPSMSYFLFVQSLALSCAPSCNRRQQLCTKQREMVLIMMSRSDIRQCWTQDIPPFDCQLDQEACTTSRSERTSLDGSNGRLLDNIKKHMYQQNELTSKCLNAGDASTRRKCCTEEDHQL